MSKSTPWGPSQGQRSRASGIVFYHTAGHGGYHLTKERMQEFRRKFPGFETFAGGPWFEEDCDAAVIALAFPQWYTDEEIRGCVRSVQHSKQYGGSWPAVNEWLEHDPEGQRLMRIADEFDRSNADKWERGGGHGGNFNRQYRGYWCQHYRRGDEHRSVMIPPDSRLEYRNWLTDDEINQFEEYDRAKHMDEPRVATPAPVLVGSSYDYADCHSDADPGL